MPDEKGIYPKYEVRKDGEEVDDCFVLEPEEDPAARAALEAYADVTENERLAEELATWLLRLKGDDRG